MSRATGKFEKGDRFQLVADPFQYWAKDQIGRVGVITKPNDGASIAPVWGQFDGDEKPVCFEENEIEVISTESEEDVVNNPSHYQSASGIEVIDVIEAFDLDRYRSNATKYILRAGNKGDFDEDIRKAVWYLERLLKWRENHA